MDSTKQSMGQKTREKLLQKIEQAKTSGFAPALPTGNIPTQAPTGPEDCNPSQAGPREVETARPRLKPFFPHLVASGRPTSSSLILIDVDACASTPAALEPHSSSLKRKSESPSPLTKKKGKILETSPSAQELSLEQLREHLSQSKKSREQLQAEVQQLQGFLLDKEGHCSTIGQRTLYLSERIRELEGALKASSDRVGQLRDIHAAEIAQLTLDYEQELGRARASSFAQGRRVGMNQGVSSGIKDCRSNLLMTPYGQAFLDSLIKRLPEAYLQSRDFWLRMFDPLTEWAASAILECC